MADDAKNKDMWDRLTALATILVPAAIALAGHFIAQGLKQAEISSQEMRAEQSNLIAEANTKIAQATLINTMMKSLTSANPQERKLAVEAVLIALPEQGATLVRVVAESDEDKAVQATAKASLEQRINVLIHELFSEDAQVRVRSAQELIQAWHNDPKVVLPLIEYAMQNKENSNGIYNTVIVLNEFPLHSLEMHKESVMRFIDSAKNAGPKTAAKVAILARRIN